MKMEEWRRRDTVNAAGTRDIINHHEESAGLFTKPDQVIPLVLYTSTHNELFRRNKTVTLSLLLKATLKTPQLAVSHD